MPRLHGLIAATFTPFRADGALDLDRVGPMVEHLLAAGVAGAFVCGSTGEGPSLTTEEREATAAAYVSAAGDRMPIVVHVGHCSLADSRHMAAHAQQIGAAAISAVSPWYFKPASVDVLIDCLAEIASAAPNVPFYYYHIPSLTGVALDLVELLEKAPRRVPTLVGVKYTAPTVDEYQSLVAYGGGRYDVLFGRDEMLLSGLAAGGRGAIGTTYNFAAPLFNRVISSFDRGDLVEARRYQADAVEMIRRLLAHGGLPAFKATMGLLGVPCGPMRLPMLTLDTAKIERIRADLESLGFFDWIKN